MAADPPVADGGPRYARRTIVTADQFRAWLVLRGLNQSSLARLLHELGDTRSVPTILRTVANWARGVTTVPGEMVVIARLLDRLPDLATEPRGDTSRTGKGSRGRVPYHGNDPHGASPANSQRLWDEDAFPIRRAAGQG